MNVVVTIARWLGRALVRRLLDDGWRVVTDARRADRLTATAAELTDDPAMVETMAALFGTDADSFRRSPLALVGSPGDIAEMLAERRERWGYSYHVIPGDKAHEFAPLVASLTGT